MNIFKRATTSKEKAMHKKTTKAGPKEMLLAANQSLLQRAMKEAIAAGIVEPSS